MKKLFNKGFTGLGQLGVLLGFGGAGLIIGSMVSVGVWMVMTGGGLTSMQTDMLNPKYAGAIKVVQAVNTLFAFFVPAVAYAFLCFRNGWTALGVGKTVNLKAIGIAIAIIICSGPLIDALSSLNNMIPLPASTKAFFDSLEKSYEDQVKVIAEVKSVQQFVLSLIMIALLPAIFEEILFRGALQGLLHRWWKSGWLAVVVTSVLFSAIHASWYGFIPRIALGLILGSIFFITQNIWYSIVVHFANNAAVVCYMYYNYLHNKPVSLQGDTIFPMWSGLLSLALIILLFRWLSRDFACSAPQQISYDPRNPFNEQNEIDAFIEK